MNKQVNWNERSASELPRMAFKIHEAAQVMGISIKAVRRLLSRGLLKKSMAMRHVLISASEIQRFLDRTSS